MYTLPIDNPALANIRFTYNETRTLVYIDGMGDKPPAGTAVVLEVEPGATNLGTFTVVSPFGPTLNTGLQYDGVSYKSTNNTQQENVGQLSGPSVPVPEPTAAAVLCTGVVGLGLRRRRGNRTANPV